MSTTILDDVFKTLKIDCPNLMLPIVNELFQETYSGNEEILLSNDEHLLRRSNTSDKKRFSDSHFLVIKQTIINRYHIECQSTLDPTILQRMAEYDVEIALEHSNIKNTDLIMEFPYSAVLYLNSTKNTPDEMHIYIKSENQNILHTIRIMKLKNYTVDDIFEKKLYLLIPFHIMVYKYKFSLYNKNKAMLFHLQKIYRNIRHRLEILKQDGILDEYYLGTILDMTRKVLEHVTKKHPNIRERIGNVMGGKVLEYPTKTAFRQAIQEGLQQGLQQGKLETCISFIKNGTLSLKDASQYLGMTEKDILTCMNSATS